jgi:hypothetical protein
MKLARDFGLACLLGLAGCHERSQPAAAPAAAGPNAESAKATQPVAVTPCAFSAPAALAGRTAKWEGECSGGQAQGHGVLRGYPSSGGNDSSVLFFYGSFERGEAKLGVIETPDGYMAGEFRAGELIASDDRNLLLRAFRSAGDAASLVSQRYQAAGNAASAAFYSKKAQSLRAQLE